MQELLRCVWVLIRCGEANFALTKMGQREFDVLPKKKKPCRETNVSLSGSVKPKDEKMCGTSRCFS